MQNQSTLKIKVKIILMRNKKKKKTDSEIFFFKRFICIYRRIHTVSEQCPQDSLLCQENGRET